MKPKYFRLKTFLAMNIYSVLMALIMVLIMYLILSHSIDYLKAVALSTYIFTLIFTWILPPKQVFFPFILWMSGLKKYYNE